ncbi:hypothetical protein TREMEDRAFT_26923, partial [Tremella mesenterica DSM 1558]|uniref:uncharacterized protein n=1 Tax=Tremella mesenterica (strain ATCC 24925 / CBS 8224 / DSM 1558 / NBRC 9311 / NRRL Y-6157 / RJB 2259-6 / UBC 559-6) TaxID=578456 RepID=UPI0003F4A4A7
KTSILAAPDPSRPSIATRKIGENKLLKVGLGKSRMNPYGNKCLDCKKCAYKKGLCAICGSMVLDTRRESFSFSFSFSHLYPT